MPPISLDWKNFSSILEHPAAGRAVTVVNVVLVVLLAASLAHLTWRVLPSPPPRPVPPAGNDTAAPSAAAVRDHAVQRIASLHLFGDAAAAPQVTAPPAVMPETKLNLVLRGVLAVEDKARAQAIIAQPNGDEQSYGIGSSLPGGAVLKDITATSVILLRNNQYETLSLPREEVGPGAVGGGQPLPVAGAANQASFPDMTLRQVRDTLLSDPQKLTGLIDAQPYTGDNGQLMGYRIEPGGNQQMFDRYGLQAGDVVTSINGIALSSTSNAFEILRGLPSRNQVQVELLRNGVPQTLTLQIQ